MGFVQISLRLSNDAGYMTAGIDDWEVLHDTISLRKRF